MKKFLSIFIVFLLLSSLSVTVSADYTLEDNKRVPIPTAYVYQDSIEGFSSVTDIFIDPYDNLYVCDDMENKIIRYDSNYQKTLEIGEELGLLSPKGIFVDDTGDIYIADTNNGRIVHTNKNGVFIEEFKDIQSPLLGEDFVFDPQKIVVTDTGYLLVIKGESIMQIDSRGQFYGYMGQPEIGYSLTDALIRIFASDEQKRYVSKRYAPPYTNLVMGSDGYIYATSRDTTYGEIKKLNSIGNNVYRTNPSTLTQAIQAISSLITVAAPTQYLGERVNDDGVSVTPVFEDIAVDRQGIITVLDSNLGKLYQYDYEGNALCCFGSKGSQKGMFDSPSSVAVDSLGRIYVGDRNLKNVQIFTPTDFITSVHNAVYSYQNGYYDQALQNWDDILERFENYRLAHKGMGLALYKNGDYKEAMDEFILANDRDNYTRAFSKDRYTIFSENFILCVVLGVAAIIAFVLLVRFLLRVGNRQLSLYTFDKNGTKAKKNLLLLSLGVVRHPIDTFEAIKYNRGRFKARNAVWIFLICIFVRLAYIFLVHFPMADVDINNVSFVQELIKLLLPILTWAVASFAITSIMNGESKFSEIFVCTAYAMVPYCLFTLPLGLVSHLLGMSEWQFYSIAIVGLMVWQAALQFTAVLTLNRFSFGKTVVVCILTVLTMLLIWAVILLCMVLLGQGFRFFADIGHEVAIIFSV